MHNDQATIFTHPKHGNFVVFEGEVYFLPSPQQYQFMMMVLSAELTDEQRVQFMMAAMRARVKNRFSPEACTTSNYRACVMRATGSLVVTDTRGQNFVGLSSGDLLRMVQELTLRSVPPATVPSSTPIADWLQTFVSPLRPTMAIAA